MASSREVDLVICNVGGEFIHQPRVEVTVDVVVPPRRVLASLLLAAIGEGAAGQFGDDSRAAQAPKEQGDTGKGRFESRRCGERAGHTV